MCAIFSLIFPTYGIRAHGAMILNLWRDVCFCYDEGQTDRDRVERLDGPRQRRWLDGPRTKSRARRAKNQDKGQTGQESDELGSEIKINRN